MSSMRFSRHPPNMTTEQVHRRAGGRRRYNFERQLRAKLRRLQVRYLLLENRLWIGELVQHGALAEIARQLGVSRATICRDLQQLREEYHQVGICPTCGQEFCISERRVELLEDEVMNQVVDKIPPSQPEQPGINQKDLLFPGGVPYLQLPYNDPEIQLERAVNEARRSMEDEIVVDDPGFDFINLDPFPEFDNLDPFPELDL
jgi:hypothetical protein